MFQTQDPSTARDTAQPAQSSPQPKPEPAKEAVRHLLFGSMSGVQEVIQNLHKLGYAEPNDWSRPMPTGRGGEVMAILTKYRRLSTQSR